MTSFNLWTYIIIKKIITSVFENYFDKTSMISKFSVNYFWLVKFTYTCKVYSKA